MKSSWQHKVPRYSLAIHPYQQWLLLGPLDFIQCPHRVDVCKFFHPFSKSANTCVSMCSSSIKNISYEFSSSALRVLFACLCDGRQVAVRLLSFRLLGKYILTFEVWKIKQNLFLKYLFDFRSLRVYLVFLVWYYTVSGALGIVQYPFFQVHFDPEFPSMGQIELFRCLTVCRQMTSVKLDCRCFIAILETI